MKFLLIFFLAAFTLLSCKNTTSTDQSEEVPTDNGGSQDDPDLVAISETIHGFYAWYEANSKPMLDIEFVKPGKPATLDMKKLEAYFALLKQSGFISQAYVDGEKAYLKNLEATAWKDENSQEEPLTGLDYSRLFCAQDWDMNYWTTAPVTAEGLGTDKVTATLSGDEGGSPRMQDFVLVKEGGKWLIAKIDCDSGAEAALPEQSIEEQMAAFYTGSLPCKDCDEIATVLTLNADEKRTYTLEEEHKGKKPKTVNSNGTWTVAGDVVTLNGKSGATKYQVTTEGLVSLNADGSMRDANSAKKYLLKKTQGE
ncbi:MAG: copper resistance protein NlpE N-terminal domain-containing protein [Bacteroidetes bacterium]|nr:copper resistance protein NlpE N-terminal domain-containing protein [Bacteroidota bacterium]